MAFFDRFKKNTDALRGAAIENPRAPVGPNELRPPVLLELTLDQSDVAVPFRDSEVAAANRVAAEAIARGEHADLPAAVASWFHEHRSQAVSPTHIGYTWYPGHTTAQMQLVHTELLELDPNPRAGSLLWGSRSVIDRWALSPIELTNDDGQLKWVAPSGFRDIELLGTTEDDVFVILLLIGADLGSEALEREFQLVLNTAVQFIEGFDHSGINNSLPRLWSVEGTGQAGDLLRAAVIALYALGDRIPEELRAALPVADASGAHPVSLVPEIAAKLVEASAVESGGVADPEVIAKAAEITAAATAGSATSASRPSVPAGDAAGRRTATAGAPPTVVPGPANPKHEFSSYQKLIDEGVELPVDDPRFDRKLRSEARLQAQDVPTLAWMSFIAGEDEARIRTVDDVVDRAVCIMALAVKAEIVRDGDWPADAAMVDGILDSYGARRSLSPAELAYLADPAPDAQTNTQFGWRYESCWALLWALGFVDELSWPTTICNVPLACDLVRAPGPEGFRAQAKLRSTAEILEEADYIYRLHWAIRQARHNGDITMPPVEPGVVMERHYALNWLRTYQDQDWDEVSTDT